MKEKPIPSLHQGPKKRLKKPVRLNFPPDKLERYQSVVDDLGVSLSVWLERAADAYLVSGEARSILVNALPSDKTRGLTASEMAHELPRIVRAVERALERLDPERLLFEGKDGAR